MKIKKWLIDFSLWASPVVLVVRIFFSGVANAQTENAPTILTNASQLGPVLFCPIIDLMFTVILVVSVIAALWAAFQYVTAGDDTEKTSKARKILTYAAVGIVVALIANGFPALVGSLFSGVDTSALCS